jgi:hypothetical protein
VTPSPADPLRRIERTAIVLCVAAAALTYLVTWSWPLALGVIGGGLLVAISLLAIRSSVDALLALMTGGSAIGAGVSTPPVDAQTARRRAAFALFRLVGRYALLAVLAYVMIARLRLHPIGLLIGASSLVASAALEAVRVLTRARTF